MSFQHETMEFFDVKGIPSLAEYEARYHRAKVTGSPSRLESLKATAKSILSNRPTYEKVEKETGVPWWWVGCIHMRESSLSFRGWLANGDPLTAATVHVPAGLKGNGPPPWSWHEAAIISLRHQGLHKEEFDSLGKCLALAEEYNGLGYLQGAGRRTTPPETSPYLWSGTDQYSRGKYVADERFDPDTVDQQLGVVAVMKQLEENGITLFGGSLPVSEVTWFEFFRTSESNFIAGMNGANLTSALTSSSVDSLITFLQKYRETAKSFRVAPQGKQIPLPSPNPEPNPEPAPVPPTKVDSMIRLKRHPAGMRSDGLIQLGLEFFDTTGKLAATLLCVSGLPGVQNFRIGKDSRAGSGEPIPEGWYGIGNLEWAAGKDNYGGSWGTGLGPLWSSITPKMPTSRSALGFHLDVGSIGTLGCVGFVGLADLKEFVRLMRLHDPRLLVVDFGLGSLPAEFKSGPEIQGSPETEIISQDAGIL